MNIVLNVSLVTLPFNQLPERLYLSIEWVVKPAYFFTPAVSVFCPGPRSVPELYTVRVQLQPGCLGTGNTKIVSFILLAAQSGTYGTGWCKKLNRWNLASECENVLLYSSP